MYRASLIALFGAVAVASVAPRSVLTADDKKAAAAPAADPHAAMFMDCAKACDDCKRSCDACGAHCAKMIAEGQKHHMVTLKTCQDCAAVCSAASCIVAKGGPFSDLICTACADACKRCGDACEQHGKGDPTMKQCADECRKCEKACRDMLTHLPKH
jgi:hypothetical protein